MKLFYFFLFIATLSSCKKENHTTNNLDTKEPKIVDKSYKFPKKESKIIKGVQNQLKNNIKDSTILNAWQISLANHTYEPIVTSKKQLLEIKETLQHADDNGIGFLVSEELKNIDADIKNIETGNFTNKDLFQAEVNYRTALNRFSNAMQFGLLDPTKVFKTGYYTENLKADSTWLANDFNKKDYVQYVKDLKSDNILYPYLLKRYKELSIEEKLPKLKEPKKYVKKGQTYEDVPKLRQRFGLAEVADTAENYLTYDDELVEKIIDFQEEHALSNDGVIGAGTISMLNQTPKELKLKVEAVLERLRWNLGKEFPNAYIVNIPEYKLYVIENNKVVKEFNVGVGSLAHKTPEFVDQMEFVVVNPTWTVPYSISTKEMLPRIKRNASYLPSRGYRLLRGNREINPHTVDWSQYSRGNFPFTIVQKPSNSNALGRIKFLFPNKYAIYLHDTPSKYIFENSSRDVSHGCVRVEDPFALGDFIMEKDPEYMKAKNSRKTISFKAKKDYPVVITYLTANAKDGKLIQVDDVYGRDAVLQEAWVEFKEGYE